MIESESKAPAIARAAAIMRLLGRSEAPMGVNAIAREIGLVPSTCLYVLRALVAEELVSFDDDSKRYALESGVLTLARAWLRRDQFADLSQPILDRLAREYQLTMLGVQITGLDHIVVVASAQGGVNFQLSTQIGSRFPALISATGRCIAAYSDVPDAQLRSRFESLRWDEAPDFDEWMHQIEETRQKGFAIDVGNYISGITVLAAPVWKAEGKPSHALVTVGVTGVINRIGAEILGQAMVKGARQVSGPLGG